MIAVNGRNEIIITRIRNAAGCFGPLGRRHPTASRRVDLYMSTRQYLALRLDASRVIHLIDYEDDDIIRVTHSPKAETIRAKHDGDRLV
ncbi:hypothetical protein PRIPAC_78812 [Pristionchus pacificus]|uniref:Uncharacterized protein n=1 Tax=Pristionchus pacificus TaxID=54126 RepID=A0A2A6CIY1_PRIPA|nr:hypothetical protein PRIPAC_78812 [Pristionchus pacificus]|eukprot:PDM78162.1 hypothetical protein PRIPAC_30741 [Pristionchus pacificus]